MCNLNDPGSPEAGSKSRDLLSVRTLAAQFHGCADFETRTVDFGLGPEVQIVACWIDGLVSGSTVTEEILRPLTEAARSGGVESSRAALERILRGSVYRYSVQVRRSLGDAVGDLTHGHCLLFFEQADAVLSFEARCEQTRAIDQPTLEKSLKGAKDSFVETLRVNTALIRRRICSPQLKLAECSIGLRTQTRVSILYMEGIADPAVVRTLAKRLAEVFLVRNQALQHVHACREISESRNLHAGRCEDRREEVRGVGESDGLVRTVLRDGIIHSTFGKAGDCV